MMAKKRIRLSPGEQTGSVPVAEGKQSLLLDNDTCTLIFCQDNCNDHGMNDQSTIISNQHLNNYNYQHYSNNLNSNLIHQINERNSQIRRRPCLTKRTSTWNRQHRAKLKLFNGNFNQTMLLIILFNMFAMLVDADSIGTDHYQPHPPSSMAKKSVRLPAQRFEMEPIDKTSITGDTIILPCRVANKVGTLQWTRDGFGLGTERSLDGFQRYRMVGSDDEGDYSLEISPVALEDDAVFQCQVGAVEGVLGIRSRSARFTVQVPPEPPVIVVTHAHSHAQVYKSIDDDNGGDNADSLTVSASNGAADSAASSMSDSGKQNDHHLRTNAGMTIELTCEAHGGRPPAELTWMDSAGNPITNSVSYSTTKLNDGKRWNAALKWTVVASRALDKQRVTCRSENAALKSPSYAHIQLEVRYAPEVELRIASVGESGLVREGDDLTLECNAMGNPSRMTFKWSRDGVPLGTEGDVGASGDGTPRLVFRRVGREFHGTVIACEVANSVGTSRAKLDIKVAFKPRFVKLPEPVIGISKNENIQLQCNIDSYPPATIYWSKFVPKLTLDINDNNNNNNNNHLPDHYGIDHWQPINTDGANSIQVSSAGRYRCMAKNSAFEDELKGETLVFIKGAPLIRSPSVQYGIENEPVRLQCIVEAVPPPTKITWYKLPYQQILGVDNNEGYEILEEEDPEDYSMIQSSHSYLTSTGQSHPSASSGLVVASQTAIEDENGQFSLSSLALLRSIIYIRRAKDSDFGQYNCSVWNQYGFQSQIITLEKHSNILSPLVLTLSGIICFAILFVLVASLLVFICIRGQRLMNQNDHQSLTPNKKSDTNHHNHHHHHPLGHHPMHHPDGNLSLCNATSCNGSVIDNPGANGASLINGMDADEETFSNKINSIDRNVLMKNTIMKMNGANQILTTVTNDSNEMLVGSNSADNSSNGNGNGAILPMYSEYDSYNYTYHHHSHHPTVNGPVLAGSTALNNQTNGKDLIITKCNVIDTCNNTGNDNILHSGPNAGNKNLANATVAAAAAVAAGYNYDNMSTYASHYIPAIDDYVSSHENNHHNGGNNNLIHSSHETDNCNKVSLTNYYHPHSNGSNGNGNKMDNHLYSTVKKNNHHNDNHNNNNNSNNNNTAINSTNNSAGNNSVQTNGSTKLLINSATNYATLISSGTNGKQTIISNNNNNNNSSTNNVNTSLILNDINGTYSYANAMNFSQMARSKPAVNNQMAPADLQFNVNPYVVRTSNPNTSMMHTNGGLSMNHYSNLEPGTVNERLLSAGVYNAHHHHHQNQRYKTNSLGGGSSSSGVISTVGSSPGHSPVGSMSNGNTNGTHV